MLTTTPPLQTANDFLAYLDEIYGITATSQKTVTDINKIWDEWDHQGISELVNMKEVASSPYDTVRAYFDDIIQACEIGEIDSTTIFFALVRIRNLNAFANTMPNADKVIVFDDNLLAFFTTFIIIATQAIYSNPNEQETQQLEDFLFSTLNIFYSKEQTKEENETYVNQFIKIIQKNYQLTEIGSYFSMAFTVFIICHELSHHILGHTEDNRIYVIPKKNQEATSAIPLNTPAHQEEFEADDYGYKLFLELIDKVDQVESAKLSQTFNRAPLMFFEIIDIVQLFGKSKGFHQQKNDTHPDPMQRKQRLLSIYNKQLPPDSEELYKGFMGFAKHIKQQLKATPI